MQIVTVDGRQVVKACGLDIDLPAYAKAAIDGETLLGVWGLAWSSEPKRCWIFFHVENYRPGFGFIIRREGLKCLRHAEQLGEREVYTPRDAQFASSLKLMKLFGFEKFAVENEIEIWQWRSSRQ